MNKKKLLFSTFIFLFSINIFGHRDFYVVKETGNIKTIIKTGYKYEEVNKIEIIGILAERLAQTLNYKEPILLDFNHFYVGNVKPTYFLSFDRGISNFNNIDDIYNKNLLIIDGIVVRQVGSSFNILDTLKILEYAIKNREKIRKTQRKIKFDDFYCNWFMNSVEMTSVKKSVLNSDSKLVNEIINTKIYRPENKNKYGITYYWKNNKFYFINKKENEEKLITTLDNVYDIQKISNVVFIFETKELFLVVEVYNKKQLSLKWRIENIQNNYKLFKIIKLSKDKFAMTTNYWTDKTGTKPKDRVLIYSKENDFLIQDLDKIMKN
ncbi:hypothetical protein [Polaribacter sp. Asnod6-C07]|uniref:hypothetical protein n=1 Tax=Polaribacter sp. Asnod6-C07 TaxID=3160582 RepID=UPI0038648B5F